MAGAWDPTWDDDSHVYANSDRDVYNTGGNHLALGNADTEFDSGTTTGVVFEVELVDTGATAGVPNGQSLIGLAQTGQGKTSTLLNPGAHLTRSGVAYEDGSFVDSGFTQPSVGDYVTVYVKGDEVWFGINGTYETGNPETGTLPLVLGTSGNYRPCCNPRRSSGDMVWRLNTLAADINGTIPSGWAAVESAGGSPTAFTADDVATAAPTLDSPALGQTHALTPTDLATGAPVLGTPALTSTGVPTAFTPDDIQTPSPTMGSPTIGGVATLVPADLASGAPTVGTPAIGSTAILVPTDLTSSAPVLGTPALGGAGAFDPTDIATQAPILSQPALGGTAALVADDIATGVPILGEPALADAIAHLTADDISSGSPVLGTPALGGGTSLVDTYGVIQPVIGSIIRPVVTNDFGSRE